MMKTYSVSQLNISSSLHNYCICLTNEEVWITNLFSLEFFPVLALHQPQTLICFHYGGVSRIMYSSKVAYFCQKVGKRLGSIRLYLRRNTKMQKYNV